MEKNKKPSRVSPTSFPSSLPRSSIPPLLLAEVMLSQETTTAAAMAWSPRPPRRIAPLLECYGLCILLHLLQLPREGDITSSPLYYITPLECIDTWRQPLTSQILPRLSTNKNPWWCAYTWNKPYDKSSPSLPTTTFIYLTTQSI